MQKCFPITLWPVNYNRILANNARTRCGKPAADAWCQKKGYTEAGLFSRAREDGSPTRALLGDYGDEEGSITCPRHRGNSRNNKTSSSSSGGGGSGDSSDFPDYAPPPADEGIIRRGLLTHRREASAPPPEDVPPPPDDLGGDSTDSTPSGSPARSPKGDLPRDSFYDDDNPNDYDYCDQWDVEFYPGPYFSFIECLGTPPPGWRPSDLALLLQPLEVPSGQRGNVHSRRTLGSPVAWCMEPVAAEGGGWDALMMEGAFPARNTSRCGVNAARAYCEGLGYDEVLYLRPSTSGWPDALKKLYFVGSRIGTSQFAVNRGMSTIEELWCGNRLAYMRDKRPTAPPRPPRPPRQPPQPRIPQLPPYEETAVAAPPPFSDEGPPPGVEYRRPRPSGRSPPPRPPAPPEELVLPAGPALPPGAPPAVKVALAGGNPREGQLRFLWPASADLLPWTAPSPPGGPGETTSWVWTVACEIGDAVARVACRQLGLNYTGASSDAFPIHWSSVLVWPALRDAAPQQSPSSSFMGTSGTAADGRVYAMRRISCSGQESSLQECSFERFPSNRYVYKCEERFYWDLLKGYRTGVDSYDDDTSSGDRATEAVAGGVYCG
ncbi:hypothetical protein HYH02_008407 [Chlamydomonas schloesseri]|uniref:SRCR domain-containing protein n=1 Tax=Chlamydomonas schloesseri TaxID=2026947 RepID=A0A835WFD1_9CHLO|nr:hypothetical protein HYH02_008407 [Chlamydomonas schloesseri]|eukprot:KAG2446413.1 hypothetical protein HYH02_008407 [Chlamydomonas schloesseri]